MPRGGKRDRAGRKKGGTNATTQAKRQLGASNLPDELERALWDEFLHHEDSHIKWEAFKMAHQYKHGMPPKAPGDKDGGQTIVIQFKRDPETPVVQIPKTPKS